MLTDRESQTHYGVWITSRNLFSGLYLLLIDMNTYAKQLRWIIIDSIVSGNWTENMLENKEVVLTTVECPDVLQLLQP